MGAEEGNLKLVQHVYGKWSAGKEGSFESFIGLLSDDVQWHSLGAGSPGMEFTAACRSREEVVNYFIGLARDWEMQRYTPEHFVAHADWVVMRGSCSWRHRRTKKICDTPKADFLRLRNGRVVEFHEFFDTAGAFDAARQTAPAGGAPGTAPFLTAAAGVQPCRASRCQGSAAMEREAANLKLVQDAYATWARGGKESDAEGFMDLLAEDVRWYSLAGGAPGMEFTAKCQCKDDVRSYFAGLANDWEMQHYTPEHYVAQGDWVVMRGSCGWRHRRTSKVCETPKADFLCLRDGKVVEFHEFFDTAAALAATR